MGSKIAPKIPSVIRGSDSQPLLTGPNPEQSYNSISANDAESENGFSWVWGGFLLINGMIGFGALAIPAGFQNTGNIYLSIAIEAMVISILFVALLIVGLVSKDGLHPNYQSILRQYFPSWAETLTAAIIGINLYVACLSYFVAIRDQFASLLQTNLGSANPASWYLNPDFLMAILSTVFVLPLILVPRIDHLKQASAAASICIIYLVAVIICTYFWPNQLLNLEISSETQKSKLPAWTYKFSAVGAFFSSFSIAPMVPPIYHRVRPHVFRNYLKMCVFCYISAIVMYNVIIVFAMITIPPTHIKIQPDILLNLNSRHAAVIVAYMLYALKMCLQAAVIAYVGKDTCIVLVRRLGGRINPTSRKVTFIASILWFATTVLLAILVPEILTAVQLDSVVASAFGVFVPGLMLWKYVSDKDIGIARGVFGILAKIIAVIISICGVIVCITSLTQAVIFYIDKYSKNV